MSTRMFGIPPVVTVAGYPNNTEIVRGQTLTAQVRTYAPEGRIEVMRPAAVITTQAPTLLVGKHIQVCEKFRRPASSDTATAGSSEDEVDQQFQDQLTPTPVHRHSSSECSHSRRSSESTASDSASDGAASGEEEESPANLDLPAGKGANSPVPREVDAGIDGEDHEDDEEEEDEEKEQEEDEQREALEEDSRSTPGCSAPATAQGHEAGETACRFGPKPEEQGEPAYQLGSPILPLEQHDAPSDAQSDAAVPAYQLGAPIEEPAYQLGSPVDMGNFVEEPAYQLGAPIEEPAYQLGAPIEEPAYQLGAPIEEPAYQLGAPIEEPAYQLDAPIEESAYQLGAPIEEPAYQLGAPIEEPAYQLGAPIEEPAYQLGGAPIEEPAYQLGAPIEEPAYQLGAPIEEPAYQLGAPMEEPAYQLGSPIDMGDAEPAYQLGAPIGEPAFQLGSPVGEPAYQLGSPVDLVGEPAFQLGSPVDSQGAASSSSSGGPCKPSWDEAEAEACAKEMEEDVYRTMFIDDYQMEVIQDPEEDKRLRAEALVAKEKQVRRLDRAIRSRQEKKNIRQDVLEHYLKVLGELRIELEDLRATMA